MNSLPLLTLMMVVPLLGAIVVAALPGNSARLAKPVALGFSLVTLLLADGQASGDFTRFGNVVSIEPPKVKLRIERQQVAKTLAAILAQHTVEDIVVEDPPLEEVIAAMFSEVASQPAP